MPEIVINTAQAAGDLANQSSVQLDTDVKPIPITTAIQIELADDYLIWSWEEKGTGQEKPCRLIVDPRMHEPSIASSYIDHLTRLNRDRGCSVSLYLSTSDAILRSFFVPAVPRSEQHEVVKWEAGKVFPFQPEEDLFAWKITETQVWGGIRKHQVQAAAIPSARIQSICDLLSGHFDFKSLTLLSLAWESRLNNLKRKLPAIADKSVAIVRLFGNRLSILCYHKLALEFNRDSELDSSVTGDEFETSLSLLQDRHEHTGDFNSYSGFDFDALARLIAEELDYYYGRFSQRTVELLLLALPEEITEKARQALSSTLGIAVESVTSGRSGGGPVTSRSSHLLIPSMLRGSLRQSVLDLLPKSYQRVRKEKNYFRAAMLVGSMMVVVTILLSLGQILRESRAEGVLSHMEETLSALKQSQSYAALMHMQTQGNAWQSQLFQMRDSYTAQSDFLRVLSSLTPERIYVSGFHLQMVKGEAGVQFSAIALDGFVSSAEEYPEVALSRYIIALREQPIVNKTHLLNQHSEIFDGQPRLRFTLIIEVAA